MWVWDVLQEALRTIPDDHLKYLKESLPQAVLKKNGDQIFALTPVRIIQKLFVLYTVFTGIFTSLQLYLLSHFCTVVWSNGIVSN